ncbi:MAG: PKD domain-containing protein [Bacteroidetes bacterium]|nr:PKD domain-containing protein [Bacteroidota bacterium]MBS1630431.1 PKD domain-containing protein [Bacteroidota bacterium]
MPRLFRFSLIFLLCMLMVQVGRAQTASFNTSVTSGCVPLIVQYNSTSTGATSYYWNLGNGASVPTSTSNPSTTYVTPGTYTITLHINGPTGPSATKTIIVYPGPTVSFSAAPSSGCEPLTVNFTSSITPNAPGALSYTWNYGDGTISTTAGANPSHTYTITGPIIVTLSVKNGVGCTTTKPITAVNVYPNPSTAFSANNTLLCKLPGVVNFISANASGISYSWSFPGGSPATSTSGTPTVSYNSAGTYSVTLRAVSAQGCKDTTVKNNYISVYANNAQFLVPDSACDSTYVPFLNTTTGVTGSTYWDFGDGTSDTGMSKSHYYTAAGTYTIAMVTEVGPCLDTLTKQITINPKPIIYSVTHDVPCVPGYMHFYDSSSVPLTTYNWSWRSGGTDSSYPGKKFILGAMSDSVTLIAGTGAGCLDTFKELYYVQDWFPLVSYKYEGCAPYMDTFSFPQRPCSHYPANDIYGNAPCNCPFPPYYCYSYEIVSQTWWLDGVQSSTNPTFIFPIDSPGSHLVVLKTVTANGCVRYDSFYVCGGYKLKPSFYAYPDTAVCVNTPVYFRNTTGDSSIKYYWYYGWNENDTNNGDYNGYHRYRNAATDTVMLISTICGCSDTASIPNYITVHSPDANFRDSLGCPPSRTLYVQNTSTGATTNYWDFGDGTSSTLANPPPHTYPDTGLFIIRHMTYNPAYGCRDTAMDSVRIWPYFIGLVADTTLCTGDTMQLFGTFNGFPPTYYGWSINDTTVVPRGRFRTQLDTVMMHRNYYNVVWYVSSQRDLLHEFNKCQDTVLKTILVSHPEADFRISQKIGCTPFPVLFIDSTSYTPGTQPSLREWIFGDGGTASNNNPTVSHTYLNAGKYGVRLKVTDWIGCTDSLWKFDSVEARHPVAAFTSSTSGSCVGSVVKFYNGSHGATALSYQWSFGDGTSSTADSPTHVYLSRGNYTVQLIATDSSGCSDTLAKTGFINITKPVAAFSVSDSFSVCPPLIVNFMNNSTYATTYNWDFKNGVTSNLKYPATTFINPGNYNVRLIAIDTNGCKDTAFHNVRILGYSGALSYTPIHGCVPLTVQFTSLLSNVPKMVWDFSNGDTALVTGNSYTYTYTTPGAYLPKLIFYDYTGCSASSSGLDTIKVDKVTAGFHVLPPCEKTLLEIRDSSSSLFAPVNAWHWDFGQGQIATGNPVSRIYPTPGRYPMTLIAINTWGCKDTLTDSFTIYPLPIITAREDTALCVPDAVPLWANGGLSYSWSPVGPLSCTVCDTPIANPTVPTSFVVAGTDVHGCINKDTVNISIQTKTTFNVVSNGEICLGDSFLLAATGATTYHWSPEASLIHADSATATAIPKVTTVYTATGREGSCLVDTHMVRVVVNPLPTIDAGKDERLIAGNKVQLQVSGNGITRVAWSPDSSLSCTDCYAPFASPYKTTTFYVTGYSSKGCKAMDSVTVRVLCDNSQLFIPNSFTPNGDGLNDYFFPRGKGIDVLKSFRVYNRWGELMFQHDMMPVNDEYAGWNGTYKGQKLNPDVFVYIIEGTCGNGEPMIWKGDITLLR